MRQIIKNNNWHLRQKRKKYLEKFVSIIIGKQVYKNNFTVYNEYSILYFNCEDWGRQRQYDNTRWVSPVGFCVYFYTKKVLTKSSL